MSFVSIFKLNVDLCVYYSPFKLTYLNLRYGLYLKLFVVMGVNWTVEVIGFAAGGSNWYWIVIDVSNLALGVFIFFIFVWKNKVRNLVRKK